MDGFEIAGMILRAQEYERLAAELDKHGGGFTKHAAAILREKAARERETAEWVSAECAAAA